MRSGRLLAVLLLVLARYCLSVLRSPFSLFVLLVHHRYMYPASFPRNAPLYTHSLIRYHQRNRKTTQNQLSWNSASFYWKFGTSKPSRPGPANLGTQSTGSRTPTPGVGSPSNGSRTRRMHCSRTTAESSAPVSSLRRLWMPTRAGKNRSSEMPITQALLTHYCRT
jgi:hypothetical protein